MERTYVMVKPDGVKRGLIGEVISRFERRGYTIENVKMFEIDKALCAQHYSHLVDKPFYPNLEAFMTNGKVVGMIVAGDRVVEGVRQMLGATDCFEALPGTIRADFATNKTQNICHASDSAETAEIEIKRFFG